MLIVGFPCHNWSAETRTLIRSTENGVNNMTRTIQTSVEKKMFDS